MAKNPDSIQISTKPVELCVFDVVLHTLNPSILQGAVVVQTVPNIQAADITYTPDGAERLGFSGSIEPEHVVSIFDRWDVDRVVKGMLVSFGESEETLDFLTKSLALVAMQPPITIDIAHTD